MDINKLDKFVNDLKFHHIGYVCKSINDYKNNFLLLSNQDDFDFIYDDIEQNVKAGFIKLRGNIYVELLEVLDENLYSPVANFTKKNRSGYHHICYETDSFMEAIIFLKKHSFRLVSKTKNGFQKREVAFFIPKRNPDGPLLEIVSSVMS
tara:strand:- start:15653 stop:16102 length:450 start_codon:yes stop_codon:yes gene_type:complete